MTLQEVADLADVSVSGLHRVLAHETDPRIGWLEQIADALDIAVAEIVAWDGEAFRLGVPEDAWPRSYKSLKARKGPPADPEIPRRKKWATGPATGRKKPMRAGRGKQGAGSKR